jgi:mono/diheme cytochrome c family protein
MKGRRLSQAALAMGPVLIGSMLCFAAVNGAWLKKVPEADRERVNPYAGKAEAIAAGENLYGEHCAQCHGQNAEGRGRRPALKSDRVRGASEGELAWLIKNGEAFKGMPSWGSLPEQERWQIVAYLKSLNQGGPAVLNTSGAVERQ